MSLVHKSRARGWRLATRFEARAAGTVLEIPPWPELPASTSGRRMRRLRRAGRRLVRFAGELFTVVESAVIGILLAIALLAIAAPFAYELLGVL